MNSVDQLHDCMGRSWSSGVTYARGSWGYTGNAVSFIHYPFLQTLNETDTIRS